jgi:phenylalanine-4-hydroxylase
MAEINAPLLEAEDLQLPQNHPGKDDSAYIRRRKMFFYLARDLRLRGFQAPLLPYTQEETALWARLFARLDELHERAAAGVFLAGKEGLGLVHERIPQLQELSVELQRRTGASLVPAEGLLHGKIYFEHWAEGVMPCTLFLRHHNNPEYTPEPDIVHDVIGHVPPLMDPEYVALIQRIGKVAKAATPEQLELLVRFYWFTVEFGLIKEDGKTKILGAGILSSIGETEHVLAGKPTIRQFDLEEVIQTEFDPTHLQPVLFVAPSLECVIEAADTLAERFAQKLG